LNTGNPSTSKGYLTGKLGLISQSRQSFILALIMALGFLLRLPNLTESLWYDELWSTALRLENLRSLAFTVLYDVHPPFYSILMFLWIKVFGDSELSVRILPLMFGLASIFLIYHVASLFTDRKTALLASFLMAMSPVSIWYSQEARSYSALSFLLLLSVLAYAKLRDAQAHRIWLPIYVVALFASAMTHFYMSFYVLLISIMCLLERHRLKRRILLVNFSILSCVGVWLLLKVMLTRVSSGVAHLRVFSPRELWQLFFNWFLLGNAWNTDLYAWPLLVVQIFFFGLFLHGLYYVLTEREKTKRTRDIALYLFLLPVIFLGFGLLGLNNYIERSMLVALPFFFIVLAKGVTGLNSSPARYACVAVVVLISIATVATYFRRGDEWTVYKPNADWRSAAHYLDEELKLSDRAALFTLGSVLELSYYDRQFREVSFGAVQVDQKRSEKGTGILKYILDKYDGILARKNEEDQHFTEIYRYRDVEDIDNRLFSQNSQTFYLIRNRYNSSATEFHQTYEALISNPRFQYQTVQSFKGIEVFKFRVSSYAVSSGTGQSHWRSWTPAKPLKGDLEKSRLRSNSPLRGGLALTEAFQRTRKRSFAGGSADQAIFLSSNLSSRKIHGAFPPQSDKRDN
jgi:dolichyl-phosphate-mannose-protein mannosyltransferase